MCPAYHTIGAAPVDRRSLRGPLELQGDSLIHLHVFVRRVYEHTFTVIVDANLKVRNARKHPN